jgi:hypothetical protein
MPDDHPRMGWTKTWTWVMISRKKNSHNIGLVGIFYETENP